MSKIIDYELITLTVCPGYSIELEGKYRISEHTHFHCDSLGFAPERTATITLCHTYEDEQGVVHTDKGLIFHKELGIDKRNLLNDLMEALQDDNK